MEIKLIEPRGFCTGVTRALKMLDEAICSKKDVYVLNDIVHNKYLLGQYENKGVHFVKSISDIPHDAKLVISPHGIDKQTFKICEEFDYVDTTCPFVERIHIDVNKMLEQNIPVVLIGKKGHIEANGIIGQRDDNLDLPEIYIVSSIDDVQRLPDFPKIGCVIQTTLSEFKYKPLLDGLKEKFPEVILQNTICRATQKRQSALFETDFDVLLVIGDKTSSNANELVRIGEKKCSRSFMIETIEDMKNIPFNETDVIAITAAASASEIIVQEVYEYLQNQLF